MLLRQDPARAAAGRVETPQALAANDTPEPPNPARVWPLPEHCMTELFLVSAVLVLLGLLWWLVEGSDDDNGGGGLMRPVLVPVPVRRYPQNR